MESPRSSPTPPAAERSALPTGLVTFVLTDIEGSTRLARRLGSEWPGVLTEHAGVLELACRGHDGILFETVGDSLLFVFSRPRDAVAAALDGQRALAGRRWPEGTEVRVRMGIHAGEVVRLPERYVGLPLHQAARISAAAHGGQVLLSSATRDLVGEEVPDDAVLLDVGSYRLKDFDEPQRLYQLTTRIFRANSRPSGPPGSSPPTCRPSEPP